MSRKRVFAVTTLRKRRAARSLNTDWPTNFAHRGTSFRAPENTLEAFRLAAEDGAGGLELDVHMTSDERIVVIHDDSTDRTTDGSGRVRRMTLREVRSLDAGYHFTPGDQEFLSAEQDAARVPLTSPLRCFTGPGRAREAQDNHAALCRRRPR